MAWIESHQSLLTHRKTGRLARTLGVSKITAIGYLHAFWWWCLDNAQDGSLASCDIEDIADGACWEDEPKVFLDALIYAGFVDATENGPIVHEWMEYAGRLIDKRKANAERMRAARATKEKQVCAERAQHVQHTTTARAGATVPNHTVPNTTNDDLVGKDDRSPFAADAANAAPPPASDAVPPKPQSAHETNDKPAPAKPRPVNPHWDALVATLGYEPSPSQRSAWGKVVKELKEMGATPEEIPIRAAAYHTVFGDITLTAQALAKHWPALAPEVTHRTSPAPPPKRTFARLAKSGSQPPARDGPCLASALAQPFKQTS